MTSISNDEIQLFNPNDEQKVCITKVNNFIREHLAFSKILINGSAGTGKTTIIISTISNILVKQIFDNLDLINDLITENAKEISKKNATYKKIKWDKLPLNNFIISAPTNKAKDVLVSKYNTYIEDELQNVFDNFVTNNRLNEKINKTDKNNISFNTFIKLITPKIIIQIINSKITFLTVSQILSIGRVINEMGIEEFTKGNDKKIIDKYNKIYMNTSIIVDECSMIDKNTSKLLNLIKCPIIYIGDYCQLPPVSEDLSIIFTENNDSDSSNENYITLKIVERCKNNITIIANNLRDKIYDNLQNFNLLKYTEPDLIFYDKKFSVWIISYVDDIKRKQKELYKLDESQDVTPGDKSLTKHKFDTMALGWTNKCCSYLNKKIRSLLFSNIENIENQYLIKGDKLLVKTPYYKYEYRIYSSTIVYVSRVDTKIYKPISFKDWCYVITKLNEMENVLNKTKDSLLNIDTNIDININTILDDIYTTKVETKIDTPKIIKPTKNKSNTNILDYFNNSGKNKVKSKDSVTESDKNSEHKSEKQVNKCSLESHQNEDLELHRKQFYIDHILNDIIAKDNYIFTDELSLKYHLIVPGYNLHNIKNLPTINMRVNAYTNWHNAMSYKLFGIPNDKISCKKCAFFVNKFTDKINIDICQSSYIKDFIDATDKLEFEMYLCDLVMFNNNGKCISKNIPILDLSKKCNIESLEIIRNIIKNSYEVKLMLSKNDEKQLKLINKSLGEEGETVDKNNKYITLSQMFGHYMSHVITSTYLEFDYGYALTVHKSQGSTYDDVYIEYNNILSNNKEEERNKLLYTAITRCVNKLHIYY